MMSWVLNVGCISEPGKHTGRPAQLRGEGTPGPQSVTPNPKEEGKGTGGNTAPPGLGRHQPATLLETFHPEQRPRCEMTAWPGQGEQDRKSKGEGLRRRMNQETVSPSGKWGDSEGEKRPIHRAAAPTPTPGDTPHPGSEDGNSRASSAGKWCLKSRQRLWGPVKGEMQWQNWKMAAFEENWQRNSHRRRKIGVM